MPNEDLDILSAYADAYGSFYIPPKILKQFIDDLRSDPEAVKLRGKKEGWY